MFLYYRINNILDYFCVVRKQIAPGVYNIVLSLAMREF